MYKRFLLPPSVAFLTLISVATGCDGGTSSGGTGGAGNNGGGGTGGATGGTGGATGGTGGATGGTGGATGGTGGATGGTGGTGGMNPACVDAPGAPPALQLTPFVSGLNRPVLLTHAPGDPPSRMYVIEQPGLIRIIENGVLLPTPFLDVTALTDGGTSGGSEQGLLGLAFHPNFAQNGRFFIYYSGDPPGQPGYNPNFTIAEYARSAADPLVANAAATAILIEEPDSFSNHNGGMMAFGADGLLYVGVGDEGDAGDPFQNAQNPDVMFGKMLRLDVDNFPTPPPGNLPNANPHVWDLGLRNPWRFSFDPCTDRLYIGDVGQGSVEEVDIEELGQGNKNYGWDCKEGNVDFEPGNCDPNTVLTPPVKTYTHGGGRCSISGGFVYRGSAIPGLRGHYFYGDYCTGQIWSFYWDGAALTQDMEHQSLNPGQFELGSFGQDAAGEIYVLELNSGNISRIDPG